MDALIVSAYISLILLTSNALRLPIDTDSKIKEITSIEVINKLHYGEIVTDPLPPWMKMRFQLSGKLVVMTLHQNPNITSNVPVLVTRDGAINRQEMQPIFGDGVYQSIEYRGSFHLSLHTTASGDYVYSVFGTFMLNNFEEYGIQPVENFDIETTPLHQVLKPQWGRTNHGGFTLTLNTIPKVLPTPEKKRNKRDAKTGSSEQWIELLMAVDFSVYDMWYKKSQGTSPQEKDQSTKQILRQFYSYVVNSIDMYFSVLPREVAFRTALVGIYVADRLEGAEWIEKLNRTTSQIGAVKSLKNFQEWSASRRGLPAHDHALAFTALDLLDEESEITTGITYLGSMCTISSHSLVEENFNFRVSLAAAHEIAHSLGADHDGANNRCEGDHGYMMDNNVYPSHSPNGKNKWKFSSCSIKAFMAEIHMIERFGVNCLSTFGDSSYDTKDKLGGEFETRLFEPYEATQEVDQMCIDEIGNGSAVCREMFMNSYYLVCFKLYCTDIGVKDINLREEYHYPTCIPIVPKAKIACGLKKWCSEYSSESAESDEVVELDCTEDEAAPGTSENCPFGDMPGSAFVAFNNFAEQVVTCQELIQEQPYMCYLQFVERRCCESCAAAHTGINNCEYGDGVEGCDASECDKYWSNTDMQTCCETCVKEGVTQPPTTAKPGCFGDKMFARFGIWNQGCEEGVLANPQSCYNTTEYAECCLSCDNFAAKVSPQVRFLKDCKFKDHDIFCWPSDCANYNDAQKKRCCFSCSGVQDIVDMKADFAESCEDTPGNIAELQNKPCSVLKESTSAYCYKNGIGDKCCATCSSFNVSSVSDCPYGDRQYLCEKSMCQDLLDRKQNVCCRTCATEMTSTAVPTFPITSTTALPETTYLLIQDSAEGQCFRNIQSLLTAVWILSKMGGCDRRFKLSRSFLWQNWCKYRHTNHVQIHLYVSMNVLPIYYW
ncbi:hypothetical protein ScPMuIL_017240 [Solemya velum]